MIPYEDMFRAVI